jgi:hypothetical protein
VALLPARADGVLCNGIIHNKTFFNWTDGFAQDVQGVRAPIEVRKDGSLCDPSVHADSQDFTWIMVHEVLSSTNLVQIGYDRYWRGTPPTSTICKFWAKQGGIPQFYECGNLSDYWYTWFTIHPTSDGTDYVIADCGNTGDYSSCTARNATQPIYNNPVGVVASEQYYGCGLHIFGSSDHQQHVGVSTSHVQGEGTGLNWMARTWNNQPDDNCGTEVNFDYNHHQDNGGEVMYFYDDRNTD